MKYIFIITQFFIHLHAQSYGYLPVKMSLMYCQLTILLNAPLILSKAKIQRHLKICFPVVRIIHSLIFWNINQKGFTRYLFGFFIILSPSLRGTSLIYSDIIGEIEILFFSVTLPIHFYNFLNFPTWANYILINTLELQT